MKTTIARRMLLRGSLGGATLAMALPCLEAMLDGNGVRLAHGADLPRRLGIWFWGNGVRLSKWIPAAAGQNYALTEELAPFARVKSKMTVVTGTEIKNGTGNGHHEGVVGILAGAQIKRLSASPFTTTFSSPSFDQIAASAIGTSTKFRSLELGISRRVKTVEGTTLTCVSHAGPSMPNMPQYDVRTVFDRLFPGGSASPRGTTDLSAKFQTSVLDGVLADLQSLQARVGAGDRQRLEQHFEHVRTLERRIANMPMEAVNTCTPPVRPNAIVDREGREQVDEVNRTMSDLLVLALSCDLTRVFSVLFSGSVNSTVFWQAGISEGHHDLTHKEGGDQPKVHESTVFTMKQLAYLIERLDAVREGAGTLLDRCGIMATTDVCEGFSHKINEYPILLFGGAGGRLQTGTHLRALRENSNRVTLSLLRAVGADLPSYGQGTGQTSEGLPGLTL